MTQNRSANNDPKKSGRFRIRASRKTVLRLTLTALFIALALAVKSLTKLPLSSLNVLGVQISFGGIFTFFPAILFGPLYGGLASAMVDFLGAMLFPTGAYIPWLTLTAFAGGVIKGYIWKLITGNGSKIIRYALLLVFIITCVAGTTFGASLSRDGIIGNNVLSVKQKDLPTKGEIQASANERGKLSEFAVGLARYNEDKFTLTGIDAEKLSASAVGGEAKLTLPAGIVLDGLYSNVTKLNIPENALDGVIGSGKLQKLIIEIPSTYKDISEGFFTKQARYLEIRTPAGSAAAKLAQENKISLVTADDVSRGSVSVSSDAGNGIKRTEFNEGGFTLRSSDAYRKYLAQYLNLIVSGFIIGGLIGVLFIGLTLVLDLADSIKENKEKKRQKIYEQIAALNTDENEACINLGVLPKKKRTFDTSAYLRILMSILIAGMFVTTVNTFILMIFVKAYQGRLFTVLLIPRICEELIVSVIQSYIISLIYTAVTTGRLGRVLSLEKL